MIDQTTEPAIAPERLAALERIQQRVLWLATAMIDHANNRRANPEGSKVGGHQASSASVVSILTALYFEFLRAGDRVSVKPHASPAYHAVQYLLGNLPRHYLTTLREFHGLQAYPSRTKDPDPVDFSTGSVGLGAVAPAFAALTHRYAKLHFGEVTSNRFISILGDAELDEGNVWEATTEGHLSGLGNVIWIVDLNRQSLDRVVPGIRAAQLKSLFRDARWHVVEAKYGRRLQAAFARPGGEALRRRIDDMSNEEYQMLLRRDGPTIRDRLISGAGADADDLTRTIAGVPDADLPALIADLGGHDLVELLTAFRAADAAREAPSVVFAYTIKGWGLPIAGDPLNHSIVLSADRLAQVRDQLGIDPADEWAGFEAESAEGQICREAAARLGEAVPPPAPPIRPDQVPAQLAAPSLPTTSSQEAFGRLLADLHRAELIGRRIVTTSPDVAISTNLAGWINRAGVFESTAQIDYGPEGPRLIRWQPGPTGQHIELGISEMNLFMLLGQLGLSYELSGQHLIPIGTVYDPFICRGL
ncbi:MAG TPA: 1-deoxy-D-xylulose-5-phosphate synthase N-terminal domain-containing protein, partial [Dehalococcoidia bacterium]|nr:1-deoxy-D-xylulose-5-phosphate synthase N-terminal domain-containing protein [Dehalococcoidia bacterium]